MSDSRENDPSKKVPPNVSEEMRRGVSRRGLLTGELRDAGLKAAKHLPGMGGFLGVVLKESGAQRDRRLVENLWQLLMGRKPKPEENAAGLDVVRGAKTAWEKGDALVDILWALCQTKEFEELGRTDRVLVRGLYLIALDREPTEEERAAALEVMAEATEPAAKVGALEGLFTGLLRSRDSVLSKEPGK
jgi:hypothetical protein